MDSQLRSQVVFHLTGHGAADALPAGLRPALMAPYRHLEDLRHDFPAVLTQQPAACAVSLTSIVDGALRGVAPAGLAGERLRKRALQLERRVRRRVLGGATGSLGALWDAEARAVAKDGTDAEFLADAARVREAWKHDGELAACDARWPARLVEHAWRAAQREKARVARARIERLVLRLEAILRADDARSPEAYGAARLQGTFGAAHRELFDFAAMSRLLSQPRPRGGLPAARRQRIERVLGVLRSQALFPDDAEAGFACAATGDALDEFLRRLPGMVELHRALQVGELEADGHYVAAFHDPVFASLDERALTPEDLHFFPDLLVCVRQRDTGSQAALLEALSTGIPLKVLVQLDDVLEQAAPLGRRVPLGANTSQLATTATSLGHVFVLQTVASHLLQGLDAVQRGLRYAGPALFCVYGGPAIEATPLPTYLVTAAALQSRAFPSFCYDPAAGHDLVSRMTLGPNPQPERDWPVETLAYADPTLQSVTESVAFTFLDFALCDPRHAAHFEPVPRSRWSEQLVPAADWLALPREQAAGTLPYVLAVDEADLLCRLVVDEQLARAAWRCLDHWRRLQELAGVHDARVERALAREREVWEARLAREVAAVATVTPATNDAVPAPVTQVAVAAAAEPATDPSRNPDEAYVETLRCSSCNECTLAFPTVFAYNEDKQAYIKDRKAATYRQLVEAAEACQVSVIHPGKPLDTDEPGLDELLERAKPFL